MDTSERNVLTHHSKSVEKIHEHIIQPMDLRCPFSLEWLDLVLEQSWAIWSCLCFRLVSIQLADDIEEIPNRAIPVGYALFTHTPGAHLLRHNHRGQ